MALTGAACADFADETGIPTSLAVTQQQPQSDNGSARGTSPTTTTPPAVVSPFTVLPAEATTGLAVRWQNDANKCIARHSATPTLHDPIILNPCADTNAQAWIVHSGYLMADANLCAGANTIGDALLLYPCTDANARMWVFNGGAVFSYLTSGGLYVEDANGVSGSPIRYNSYASPDQTLSNWHLTGVGTRQGAPISWCSSPNQCMTQRDGNLKVSSCSVNDANQRWALLRGDWAGNGNRCIVGSVPNPGLAMLPCASVSNTSDNNQGWYVQSVVRYATSYADVRYQLSLDDQKQNMTLVPLDPDNPSSQYYWGGKLVFVAR